MGNLEKADHEAGCTPAGVRKQAPGYRALEGDWINLEAARIAPAHNTCTSIGMAWLCTPCLMGPGRRPGRAHSPPQNCSLKKVHTLCPCRLQQKSINMVTYGMLQYLSHKEQREPFKPRLQALRSLPREVRLASHTSCHCVSLGRWAQWRS